MKKVTDGQQRLKAFELATGKPWWKETADHHAELSRIGPAPTGKYSATGYDPSLVTGRCRCKACRAGVEAGYRPSILK